MAGYIGSKASVVSSGAERKKTFAITTTTTALTGLSYTPTKVHVFHNGVRLVDGTDYTATNSTSITLTVAAESGDQVVVVSYASFQVADAYTQTEADAEFVAKAGDTMTGPLSVTGTVTADGLTSASVLTLSSAFSSGSLGGIIRLADAGTQFGDLHEDSGNFLISSAQVDKDIIFKGNDGGSVIEAMRIDMSGGGNVGIGTSAPAKTLDVAGQIRGIDRYYFKRPSDSYSLSVLSRWDGSTGSPLTGTVGINTAIGSEEAGGSVIIAPANSERMSISPNGHVKFSDGNLSGYSQTSGRGGSAIYADTGASGGTIIQTNNANNGWSPVYLNKFNWAAGKDGRLIQFTVNGSGAAGGVNIASASTITYNTSSDYRLKENVVYEWDATTRLKQLKPARFNFILDGTDTPQDGFMAHEAQEVVPLSVSGTKDAMKDEEYEVTPAVIDENGTETTPVVMGTRSVIDPQSIDHSMLVPLLVKTIQELEARIATLEGN